MAFEKETRFYFRGQNFFAPNKECFYLIARLILVYSSASLFAAPV